MGAILVDQCLRAAAARWTLQPWWGPGRWALGLRRGLRSRTGRAAAGTVRRRPRTGSPAAASAHGGAGVDFLFGGTGVDTTAETVTARPTTGSPPKVGRPPGGRVAPRSRTPTQWQGHPQKSAARPVTGCPPAHPQRVGQGRRECGRQLAVPGSRRGTGSHPRGWAAGQYQGHPRSRGRWLPSGTRRGLLGSPDRPQVRIANALRWRWTFGRPVAEWAAAATAMFIRASGPRGRRRGLRLCIGLQGP